MISVYKKYVPVSFREKIYNLFIEQLKMNFKYFGSWMKGLGVFIFSPFFPRNEYYDAFRYIGRHGVTNYPFKTSVNYKKKDIPVYHDDEKELPYVMHYNKKLYFPATASDRYIRKIYRHLLIERDVNSSHRYLKSFDELTGKILLDIGAAEGIFSLDAIDYIKKVYLFECEDKWFKPLCATFEPWKDKVELVRKYVNSFDDEMNVTLDNFMKEREHENIHLKMDIEGAEMDALRGAGKLLTTGNSMSYSICTYHKKEDAGLISSYFADRGYSVEFTPGYFFMMPYMLKGICRGKN